MKYFILLFIFIGSFINVGCSSFVSVAHKGPLVEDEGKRTWGRYIDDGVIESKAQINLKNTNPNLNSSRIKAVSFNGIVLLVGQTPSADLSPLATEIVQNIRHVKAVENQITVGDSIGFMQKMRDNWLASKVKFALSRSPDVNATRIKVVTENGAVYLMGLIKRQDAQNAVEITSTVQGISRIIKVFEYLD